MQNYTELKADVAKRSEDLRIARKHRHEAEDRWVAAPTEANLRAAKGAQEWADDRHAAYLAALDALNAVAEGAAA